MIQLHKFYLAIPYKSANFVVLATLEISTRIFFVANIALIVRVIDITDAVNIDRKIRTIYTTRTVRAVPAPHTVRAVCAAGTVHTAVVARLFVVTNPDPNITGDPG